MPPKKLLVITGPTASGKTSLAVEVASLANGEIISADSRQVYQGMDIGTGKDLHEYHLGDQQIPYHLIDICEVGEQYDGFRFQQDFYEAFQLITSKDKVPILCGGTGMYINLALNKQPLLKVERNEDLRRQLNQMDQKELINVLSHYDVPLHNTTDVIDRERTIRAIEIEDFKQNFKGEMPLSPVEDYLIFATNLDRDEMRKRIRIRLDERIEAGMLAEVERLKDMGVRKEILDYYGLEYRYINLYLEKELTYDMMYTQLLQAIRRFAKKQTTWFRRMEKQGYAVNWLDGTKDRKDKVSSILQKYGTI